MDHKQPLLESEEGFTPLILKSKRKWSLPSLLLAAYSLVVSIALIITILRNPKSQDSSHHHPKSVLFRR